MRVLQVMFIIKSNFVTPSVSEEANKKPTLRILYNNTKILF